MHAGTGISQLRRFLLKREQDPTGISGTGIVAEGALLSDGRCVVHWLTDYASINIYATVEDMEALHGHDGQTKTLWCQDDDAYDATLDDA
jgi:hypothetical protein